MCGRKLKIGAPGAIPTRDLPLRRRTLYATELREQAELGSSYFDLGSLANCRAQNEEQSTKYQERFLTTDI